LFTLSEAQTNAVPILSGLTDDDLLKVINQVLAERKSLNRVLSESSPAVTGVARGREMFRKERNK
jgi:hypothetical protein